MTQHRHPLDHRGAIRECCLASDTPSACRNRLAVELDLVAAIEARKLLVEQRSSCGISSRRLPQRLEMQSHHIQAERQVGPDAPRCTAVTRSPLVQAITRTSTVSGLLWPTGCTSRSSRSRSSRSCALAAVRRSHQAAAFLRPRPGSAQVIALRAAESAARVAEEVGCR